MQFLLSFSLRHLGYSWRHLTDAHENKVPREGAIDLEYCAVCLQVPKSFLDAQTPAQINRLKLTYFYEVNEAVGSEFCFDKENEAIGGEFCFNEVNLVFCGQI